MAKEKTSCTEQLKTSILNEAKRFGETLSFEKIAYGVGKTDGVAPVWFEHFRAPIALYPRCD